MSPAASRSKRAKSQSIDDADAQVVSDSAGGEMKQLQPRRGEGPYSLARLERALAQLVDGQNGLLARIEMLEATLADRDQRVAELEAEAKAGDDKRTSALARIDHLIDQLDELEGRAESAALSPGGIAPLEHG